MQQWNEWCREVDSGVNAGGGCRCRWVQRAVKVYGGWQWYVWQGGKKKEKREREIGAGESGRERDGSQRKREREREREREKKQRGEKTRKRETEQGEKEGEGHVRKVIQRRGEERTWAGEEGEAL